VGPYFIYFSKFILGAPHLSVIQVGALLGISEGTSRQQLTRFHGLALMDPAAAELRTTGCPGGVRRYHRRKCWSAGHTYTTGTCRYVTWTEWGWGAGRTGPTTRLPRPICPRAAFGRPGQGRDPEPDLLHVVLRCRWTWSRRVGVRRRKSIIISLKTYRNTRCTPHAHVGPLFYFISGYPRLG
jgi:hypothetical protein